jgi:hypothetical protein
VCAKGTFYEMPRKQFVTWHFCSAVCNCAGLIWGVYLVRCKKGVSTEQERFFILLKIGEQKNFDEPSLRLSLILGRCSPNYEVEDVSMLGF